MTQRLLCGRLGPVRRCTDAITVHSRNSRASSATAANSARSTGHWHRSQSAGPTASGPSTDMTSLLGKQIAPSGKCTILAPRALAPRISART